MTNDDSKTERFTIRLNAGDMQNIREIKQYVGKKSMSSIVRKMIRMAHSELREKNECDRE